MILAALYVLGIALVVIGAIFVFLVGEGKGGGHTPPARREVTHTPPQPPRRANRGR